MQHAEFPIGTFCQEKWTIFSHGPVTVNAPGNFLLKRPKTSCTIYFPKYWIPEFWATFSYELLLQRFFWNSSGIFIISIKADTRNFSKKYQQNFLLDAIFFEQKGPFKP